MGAYQDSLAAARRQRLMRMSAAAAPQTRPETTSEPTRKEIEAILRRLDALEARVAASGRGLSNHGSQRPAPCDASRRPTVSDIKQAVCREYAITLRDLEGQSRSAPIVQARQVALYLARQSTALSLQEIGRLFGRRDHTTALYAHQRIKRLRTADRDLDHRIATIETALVPDGDQSEVAGHGGTRSKSSHNDQ